MAIKKLIWNKVPVYPLITFRIVFGLLMFISTMRFWLNGWIETQLINPSFHFKYFGFHWVGVPSPSFVYAAYALLLVSTLSISVGFLYRLFTVVFFVCFTYVELIDITYYLNHYYFISLLGFVLIFLPANQFLSVDNLIFKKQNKTHVAARAINIIKFQLGVVYFYAGLAKLNLDWLLHALPLKIWLKTRTDFPILGYFFQYDITSYLFSYGGAIFDLTIFFFLAWKKSRPFAYLFVIGFHIITWALFPIGMFPFIMIASTLIFFSSSFHKKLLSFIPIKWENTSTNDAIATKPIVTAILIAYACFQLLFPFRFLAYKGNLFWHEQGFRFSWRVMLIEKMGYATFYVHDSASNKIATIENRQYLTPSQIKQMSTQPDLILQFAHFLEEEYKQQGFVNPKVTVECYVTLNGRGSQLYINPNTDLTKEKDTFAPKNWILPLNE